MKIGHSEMDPASGLDDKYVAFEGSPAEPSIQHRVAQLTEQQTKIPHVDVAQFVRRALHRKAGDFLAAAVLAPGNTADAANFEGTCVPLSVVNEWAGMADNPVVEIADQHAIIGIRPHDITPRPGNSRGSTS